MQALSSAALSSRSNLTCSNQRNSRTQKSTAIAVLFCALRMRRPFHHASRGPPPPCCTGEALHYGILASPVATGGSGERSESIGAFVQQPLFVCLIIILLSRSTAQAALYTAGKCGLLPPLHPPRHPREQCRCPPYEGARHRSHSRRRR